MKKSFIQFPVIALAASAMVLAACSNDEEPTADKKAATEQTSEETPTDNGTEETPEQQPAEPEVERDAGGYIIDQAPATAVKKVDGIVIANKRYPMPGDYAPGESADARAAFAKLNAAAQQAGYTFNAFSTYRSYDRQTELYNNYVAKDGQEAADRYSARPGFSEHQTGLAFDIGETSNPNDYASNRFGETAAGKWLAENAHDYGFIMRYPDGKEEVTGYMYESWHFRYVGNDIATEIYNNDSTLEEYLGVEG
ncbi:M15 family metallopeptidase [Kurthia huakuii]|uniref:M15 family metallopeptidase n=1 Tax=Kurthia huakuii TaxID=1421019 RepID=UPI000497EDA9|nr:M15 family metallopeptidase [Kurthia huakuii]MBM7700786.1 D-alanyl-D-alanine carboxypeptidase [Kurthia huakuii]